MQVDRSPNLNLNSARVLPILIRRTQWVFTGSGATTTRRAPSALGVERAEMSGDNGIALQHAPASNPSNDEQGGYDLFNPSSH